MDMHRIERNDIRMLEPRQPLRFDGSRSGYFEHYVARRQVGLPRAKDDAKRATSQLFDQVEPGERLANPRKCNRLRRASK
jgi:hypothetical protein